MNKNALLPTLSLLSVATVCVLPCLNRADANFLQQSHPITWQTSEGHAVSTRREKHAEELTPQGLIIGNRIEQVGVR